MAWREKVVHGPPDVNTAAIVQARMSSERLPGKLLHRVCGKPLLQYVLERLARCPSIALVVVATSTSESDTAIADFCGERGVRCHRGPLLNVAARFLEVVEAYQPDAFVRVSADSPMLDQHLVETGLGLLARAHCEMVTNLHPRTYPKGESVEILKADAFRRAFPRMRERDDLEHVTPYFYRHEGGFTVRTFSSATDFSTINLSVDTAEDMQLFTNMVERMERPHWQYGLEELLQIRRRLCGGSG